MNALLRDTHPRLGNVHGERRGRIADAMASAGAASGPRRKPSQTSRSGSFARQNSVDRPSLVSTSHACGSSNPVRWWKWLS